MISLAGFCSLFTPGSMKERKEHAQINIMYGQKNKIIIYYAQLCKQPDLNIEY